jgi:hypothetical protein
MNDEQLQTVEQVRQFMEGSEAVEFRGVTAKEKYNWIEEVLIRFSYHSIKRVEKGVIRRYIQKVTGYSRSQVSRLIAEYKRTGRLRRTRYRRHCFPRKYTPSEVGLLARTDELHEWLSGPATKKVMERE